MLILTTQAALEEYSKRVDDYIEKSNADIKDLKDSIKKFPHLKGIDEDTCQKLNKIKRLKNQLIAARQNPNLKIYVAIDDEMFEILFNHC